jgi:hypothetical protein
MTTIHEFAGFILLANTIILALIGVFCIVYYLAKGRDK